MIRLFTALKIPDSLKKQIAALPEKGLNSARFQHPEDLHITLRFIGEAEEEKLPEIMEILDGVRIKQFDVVVNGLDVFQKKKQSILYAPVESVKKITHLSAEVTERLQKLGFIFTEQFYTPHVTVARLKNDNRNDNSLSNYIVQHQTKIRAEWKAELFYLFQSSIIDDGPRYKALREFRLDKY